MLELKDRYIYSFDRNNEPVADCQDGDLIRFHTLDCFGGQIRDENDLIRSIVFEECNPATGPLYVNGAKKGDVLAVDILDIETADHGFVCTLGYGALSKYSELRTRKIEVKDGLCRFNDIRFRAEPMIGVIGTAPADRSVACARSFECGGNMDSRKIVKGVTVYLPVAVDGALLAMGDVHAAMGDGEVAETGVEIAAKITVRVRVIRNFELRWPVTETKDAYFVNTCGKNCDAAIQRGYEELLRLVVNAYGWDETDATLYLSMQALVEANQAVLNESNSDEGGDTFRVGIPKLDSKNRLIPSR